MTDNRVCVCVRDMDARPQQGNSVDMLPMQNETGCQSFFVKCNNKHDDIKALGGK